MAKGRRKGPTPARVAAPADPLEAMVRAVDRREVIGRELDRDLARAVYLARRYDVTWDDIGKRFGISRQAAHQRWSKYEAGEQRGRQDRLERQAVEAVVTAIRDR